MVFASDIKGQPYEMLLKVGYGDNFGGPSDGHAACYYLFHVILKPKWFVSIFRVKVATDLYLFLYVKYFRLYIFLLENFILRLSV